jgi:outer membrane protein OmpA-like peptidoglycan-associated protein
VQKELEKTREELKIAQAGQIKERVDTIEKKTPTVKTEKLSTETTSGSSIIIRFPMGVVELDDEAKQALDKFFDKLIASGQEISTSLSAVPGPETYSEGKRLSFFRAVAVRNYLISKGVAKNNIESKVLGHDKRDPNDPEGRVMIDLKRASP